MGDWCAGFSDSDDDYLDDFTADDIVEDNKPAARKPARILTCPHCHSYNLRMRDSTRESTVVRFQCKTAARPRRTIAQTATSAYTARLNKGLDHESQRIYNY